MYVYHIPVLIYVYSIYEIKLCNMYKYLIKSFAVFVAYVLWTDLL